MPEYKPDTSQNRMMVDVDPVEDPPEVDLPGGDDAGGGGGSKKGVMAAVALLLFALVGGGIYAVASGGDDTDTVVEDTQDDDAAGDTDTDDTATGDDVDADEYDITDEEADELIAILDGVGDPIFTIDDIPPDVATPSGGVTLFGAMGAALREVNTDPAAQPFYPVAWGSMDAEEDGSAGSWYFSMAQVGQADLTIHQVDVSGDGIVTLADVVHGPDYGFSGSEMFGSYPPGGMDSPGLWAAAPHPPSCTSWQDRGLSYYYDEEHGMPVVIFAGNDPVCFPDGPLWLHIDPVTGAELDVPGP